MTAPSYADLLCAPTAVAGARIERINGVGERLAYNPCLIRDGDDTLLAVRVESPTSYWRDRAAWDPQVRFFRGTPDGWTPAADLPVFEGAEDPFAAWMRDADGRPRLVLGVVGLDYDSSPPIAVTRFFDGPSVAGLNPDKPFLEVPRMKDIRLLQRAADVVVCGRPQGGRAGIGRISVTTAPAYTALTRELIENAHIFADQVSPGTKLGTNELHDLGDGTVGVLGHVAIGEEGATQRYAAAWWIIDPAAPATTAPRLIATRDDFPPGPAKFPQIADVVFPGSLEPLPDGTHRMYCGLGDACVASAVVRLPRG